MNLEHLKTWKWKLQANLRLTFNFLVKASADHKSNQTCPLRSEGGCRAGRAVASIKTHFQLKLLLSGCNCVHLSIDLTSICNWPDTTLHLWRCPIKLYQACYNGGLYMAAARRGLSAQSPPLKSGSHSAAGVANVEPYDLPGWRRHFLQPERRWNP